MSRALALLLAIAAVLWVQHAGTLDGERGPAGTALALGFALLGAGIVGDVLSRLHLPKLTGYLLFGALVGPYLGNVITESMADQLQIVTGTATTLIALIAGLTLSAERLGRRLMSIVYVTGTTLTVVMFGVAAVAWIAWPWLPIAPAATGVERLAMVALLAAIVASFSPTMTAAVITHTGARGRLSELVLTMVVLADLVLLVLFSLLMAFGRLALQDDAGDSTSTMVRLAWEIGGAVAFGVFVGAVFALYLRYVGREVPLVLVVVCGLLSQIGTTQQFEPLLAAVAAGLVIENLSVAQGDALKGAVQRGATPVLVLFFAAVGASLRLDALATVGLIALAASALRVGLIRIGVQAGTRLARINGQGAKYAWTGLISQAGVTLGFASVVASEFPDWGPRLQTLLVALIALHELAGPLLFRYGLVQAGELETPTPRPLLVVSNREPYLHKHVDGEVVETPATGGVAVALDALMRERGGVWIAHGAGEADRLVVDAADKVRVPQPAPAYDLRRLWIEEPTFSAYYGGFANEGLWPLCHQVDIRPRFRSDDWAAYCDVNERFAAAIHDELRSSTTPVFIQDYHLALVAPSLRRRRPEARTALFWHIPWPSPDRLRICPWRQEILTGLLGNDLLAFQLERDRQNFLSAVSEELDAEVELEASRVTLAGRRSTVVSVPIGVDYDRIRDVAAGPDLIAEQQRLRELLGIEAAIVGVGVDRLDYTKGIPERLAALDELMRRRPEWRGQLTFVQIGVPSRSALESYAAIELEVSEAVSEINRRHAVPGRPPLIRYYTQALTLTSLVALYRMAHFCIVSSLHDGMNLVAKEYVAAKDDDGVLVLSALAGAAQELREALIINPYDVDGFAAALITAIEMPATERAARMRAMRRVVAGRNVFGWASDILEGLESLWTKPLHYAVRGWEDTSV
jgi:trehalose-6-phosphate synthase/Kef-type K+ transport system membrane component KefB